MSIKGFAPIEKIDNARGFAQFPDIPELVTMIEDTESKAAKFLVEHTGDEFNKYRKALQRHANSKGYTAQIGTTEETKDGTKTQVALIPKVAGRPPKSDDADATAVTTGAPAPVDAVATPPAAS